MEPWTDVTDAATMPTNQMEKIRRNLVSKGQLYYDPDFEANIKSIYKTRQDDRILWKRPKVTDLTVYNANRHSLSPLNS